MIQIYKGTTQKAEFGRNGDEVLFPSEAYTHSVLNGSWGATLKHPIDKDGKWKNLIAGNVVKMPSFNGDQLYRIVEVEKKDTGINCEMEPIFYDSADEAMLVDVRPTKRNGQQALNLMIAQTGYANKYEASSDISKTATAYYQFKNLIQAINGDDENSFINRWGGEVLYDNFKVIINDRVGGDYGVEVRYGKNTVKDGVIETTDMSVVLTKIYPVAYNGYAMTNNGYVYSPLKDKYPNIHAAALVFDGVKMREDADEDDEENGVIICDTQEEIDAALKECCQKYYDQGADKPAVTIEVDMVQLSQTELYKDYAELETVSLGDTIHCIHSVLGIATDARIIELEYDSIHKKIRNVVIGDYKYDFLDETGAAVQRVSEAFRSDGSVMAEKVKGFLDGSQTTLKAQYNVAKKQDVMAILFENLDTNSPLYGAMAMGTQGLMIASKRTTDGRDWDWSTALTAKGLMAGIVVAGIISDKTGKNWWDLDKGVIHLESGIFSGDLQAAGGTFSGDLQAAGGTFSGDLEAAGGTFSGDLQAAGGTFSGDLEAAGGSFSGDITGASGTFSGNLSANSGEIGSWQIDQANGKIKSADGKIELDAKNNQIKINGITIKSYGKGARVDGGLTIKCGTTDEFSDGSELFRLQGLNSSSGGSYLEIRDNQVFKLSSSSQRYKDIGKDISKKDMEEWYKIKTVWAKYKENYLVDNDERCGREFPMLIAEDVEEHFPLAVDHLPDGRPEKWNPNILVPAILAMVKEHEKEIREIKSKMGGVEWQ